MRQLVYILFITNNCASFHLWWKENLVKHQKVLQYYFHDRRYVASLLCNILYFTSVTIIFGYISKLLNKCRKCRRKPWASVQLLSRYFVFHWNLISICGHNFIKLSLRACITTNQCDILCLSEIFWIVVFYGYYRRTLDIHFFHFSHVKRGNGHNLWNFISLYRSNFRGKAELFSNFLAQQCTLMDNASEIPSTLNIKTAKTLSSIPVTRADIAKIIKKRCKWFYSNLVLKVICFSQNGESKCSSGIRNGWWAIF